jgi:O-antigen/teichoic acid export membrane protein
LVSGSNFFSGVLLARFLGVEQFGVFSLAWMLVLFFNSIQNALVISPMMSIGVKELVDSSDYFGAVFIHQLIISFLSFCLILTFAILSNGWYPEWQLANLCWPLATCSFCFQLQDFVRRYFFTVERATSALLNDFVSYFSQIAFLTFFAFLNRINTTNSLLIIASTSFFAAILGLITFGHLQLRLSVIIDVAIRHWHYSRWLITSTLMQWTSWNFFIIVGSTQYGPVIAGALRATQNIIGVTHIIFQGLANVVPIQAAKILHKGGIAPFKQYIIKISIWGGTTTAVFCTIVSIWAEYLLRLFYGAEYICYVYILRWWSVSYLLIFFGVPLTSALRALENTRPLFLSYCVVTLFSLLSAKYIVTNFGIHGTMAGVFCTQILLQVFLLLSFIQILKKWQKH